MAVILFDNYKFSNVSAPIPPMQWGAFTAAGTNNVTNTYANNGYSSSGLDLSVTTATATTHGSNYVSKSGITTNNTSINIIADPTSTGKLAFGVNVTQYQQSGAITAEPQLLGDMSVLGSPTSLRTAHNGDGSHLIVLRFDSTSSSTIVDLYTRNSTGGNAYTFNSNITTVASSINSSLHDLKFSDDGIYFSFCVPKATTSNVFIFKRSGVTSNSYTQVRVVAINGTPTSVRFMPNNSLIVGCTLSPFINFLFKTANSDTWTQTSNPTTLPTSSVLSVAPTSTSNVIGMTGSSPYYISYTSFTSASAPVNNTYSFITGFPAAPTSMDAAAFSAVVFGFSVSPYVKAYNLTSSATLPAPAVAPTQGVSAVKLSQDGSFLFVGYNGAVSPSMYKIRYNGASTDMVNYSVSLPAATVLNNTINYSSDNNYFTFTNSSNATQPVYTFDQQISVPVVISQNSSNASNLADNYAYIGGPSRFSFTIQDEMFGLRYYSSNTGAVYTHKGSFAATVNGFADNTFSNAYFELSLVCTAQSSITGTYYLNGVAPPSNYIVGNTAGTATIANITDFNVIFSGPVTVTLKRDINTTGSATVNSTFTDLYLLDGSGMYNNTVLGPVTVLNESLTSDASKQWSSSTGTTSYQLVSNNPPDPTKYVFSNTNNATDSINVTNSDYVYNTSYASKINVKAKSTSTSTNGVSIVSQDLVSSKRSVTTSFSDIDYYDQLRFGYVALTNTNASSGIPVYVYKVADTNVSGNIGQQLTVNGLPSGTGLNVGLSPDGSILAVGTAIAGSMLTVYSRVNDVYTNIGQTFSDVTSNPNASTIEFSPDGKYFVISFNTGSNVNVYRNNGNNTFTNVLTLTGLNSITTYKFTKGGKYLYLGANTAGGSFVYRVDSSTDTFTLLSGVLTTAATLCDSTISIDGTVEYLATSTGSISGTASNLRFYKVNNDDTFTAANILSQSSITASSLNLSRPATSTSDVYLSYASTTVASTYVYSTYTVSTNTLGNNGTPGGGQPVSVAINRFARYGFGKSMQLALGSDGSVNFLLDTGTGRPFNSIPGGYPKINQAANATWTQIAAAEIFTNSNKIGYKYVF